MRTRNGTKKASGAGDDPSGEAGTCSGRGHRAHAHCGAVSRRRQPGGGRGAGDRAAAARDVVQGPVRPQGDVRAARAALWASLRPVRGTAAASGATAVRERSRGGEAGDPACPGRPVPRPERRERAGDPHRRGVQEPPKPEVPCGGCSAEVSGLMWLQDVGGVGASAGAVQEEEARGEAHRGDGLARKGEEGQAFVGAGHAEPEVVERLARQLAIVVHRHGKRDGGDSRDGGLDAAAELGGYGSVYAGNPEFVSRVPTNTADKPGANLDEILRQALSKAYKCPSCQETYGQVPAHRDDCDLKLLLDQGGQPDPGAAGAGNDFAGNHLPQWSSDKQFEWSDRPQAMYSGGDITPKIQASPYNLSQDLLRISGREGGESQVLAIGFENTNISSWKDYASISKLLYSTSYLDGKSPQAGTALSPTLQWTGVLPPVGTLSLGFPTLPSATKNTQAEELHSTASQRFSALLAATKGMSADAADLFRESEAALQGDGNIVNSLSNLSVSDLMRSSTGDKAGADPRLGHRPISLSGLLSGDQPLIDMSLEGGVQFVLASDFQGCGFPALDASMALVGFYNLLTETPRRTTLHAEHVSIARRDAARAGRYHYGVDENAKHLLSARVNTR
ncbi:hypothetical protein ON010_g10908 [Phytophthora cinnamomi]|nr:hypothetical protein ON010_g10908 [Phytophthora cinnamomi]